MNFWIVLVVVLSGVNLARTTGRGIPVGIAAMAAIAVLVLTGVMSEVAWSRIVPTLLLAALIIVAWQRWVLSAGRRRQLLGLTVFLAGCGGQAALLGVSIPVTVVFWPWLAAFLLLADPGTRVLRLGMSFMGKEMLPAPDVYGRGEAIGVLERWIALVMISGGDYAALGFILAAKALARHKRFEEDPEFAEYFLVGTLSSVLLAIAVAEGLQALLF